jgi:hypothetical protein
MREPEDRWMSLSSLALLSRLALVCVLAVALAGAGASGEDVSENLDEVDDGRSEDLDEADTGASRNVDRASTGRSRAPRADADASENLDEADVGEAENLDAVDVGETETTEQVDRHVAWSPPSCDTLEVALGDTPEGADGEAWKRTLGQARSRLEAANEQVAEADAAYSQMMTRGYPTGAARAEIVAQRDGARSAYAEARCALPALVERARRSGAPADAWRSYL